MNKTALEIFYETQIEILRTLANAASKMPDGRIHYSTIEALANGLEATKEKRARGEDV